MMTLQRLFLLLLLLGLVLPACAGNAPVALGVAGTPTLVFIYTDG